MLMNPQSQKKAIRLTEERKRKEKKEKERKRKRKKADFTGDI
jgi:hypothetical protein